MAYTGIVLVEGTRMYMAVYRKRNNAQSNCNTRLDLQLFLACLEFWVTLLSKAAFA